MYSEDLRWLVVFKRLILGEDHAAVTEALCGKLCKKTHESEIIERFLATGDVKTWKGRREAPPANKVVHAEDDLWLLGSVIDDPAATLEARTAEFALYDEHTIGAAVEEAIRKHSGLPTTNLDKYWGHQHLLNVLGSHPLGATVSNDIVSG